MAGTADRLPVASFPRSLASAARQWFAGLEQGHASACTTILIRLRRLRWVAHSAA